MVQGISHMTFVVADLDRMQTMLEAIFDARLVYDSKEQTFSVSRERFFLIGDVWIAIMEGKSIAEPTYNHIAFKIDDDDFDNYLEKISDLGLKLLDPRPRVEGEGRSIYFYDYDNHLFELHSGTLAERLARYGKGR